MNFLKVAPTVFCMALLGTMFSPSAKADDHVREALSTALEPLVRAYHDEREKPLLPHGQ